MNFARIFLMRKRTPQTRPELETASLIPFLQPTTVTLHSQHKIRFCFNGLSLQDLSDYGSPQIYFSLLSVNYYRNDRRMVFRCLQSSLRLVDTQGYTIHSSLLFNTQLGEAGEKISFKGFLRASG